MKKIESAVGTLPGKDAACRHIPSRHRRRDGA